MMRTLISSSLLLTVALTACGQPAGPGPSTAEATADMGSGADFADALDHGADGDQRTDGSMVADLPDCGCPVGDGPYCGSRALALAAEVGCALSPVVADPDALYSCESGVWTVGQECAGDCAFEPGPLLDDACVLPECECFVQVSWCGSGAAKVAEERGCQIPLLPEHHGDILHCPGGEWAVRDTCGDGCIEAPTGTPDVCKTESDYLLPVPCPTVANCTNGNDTGTHTGKDHYAYDFGMPVGSDIVAMRGGVVHRVRNVSTPGSACYNGGGSGCANYANTVEIKHTDGTIGLYMHLRTGTVEPGDLVMQGDEIGVSGNSGWSTGPHLHVQVQQNCGSWWCQSIPFRFGERADMTRGTQTTSANCRD